MKLKITKDFQFAHRGCDVKQYTKGEEVESDDKAFIDVSTTEKWAKPISGADRSAPENKAIEAAEETKADQPAA